VNKATVLVSVRGDSVPLGRWFLEIGCDDHPTLIAATADYLVSSLKGVLEQEQAHKFREKSKFNPQAQAYDAGYRKGMLAAMQSINYAMHASDKKKGDSSV